MKIEKEPYKPHRRTGPKRVFRTDITLAPSVAEAAVLHAKELKMSQVEYFQNAVAAYFKETLLNPPEPIKTKCEHCGAAIRPQRSGWKRLRTCIRFDDQTRGLLESLSEDYFVCNWSRAFEAACRFYLGEDRNPPPEGSGKIMGVKLQNGRKSADNPAVKLSPGRPVESIEGMIKKHGGKV